MLKNLYNAFNSELEYIYRQHHIETIDERTLLRLHGLISDCLVSSEEQVQFRSRPVRISGTEYAGLIPCYSAKDSDILAYRRGLIHFYEHTDYSLYADYYLNRLLERLKEVE
jgi:hypothetical protein